MSILELSNALNVSEGVLTEAVLDDPTFRISRMEAATRTPVSVPPTASLREAVTTMLLHDFSQLPVMQREREVQGVISWQSIARRHVTGSVGELVKDFMGAAKVVEHDASLLTVMREVSSHDCVLVRSRDKRITGIITISDLSDKFLQLTEPFLLLSEIERTLRGWVSVLPSNLLSVVCEPTHSAPQPSDLTFGQYVRLLETRSAWDHLAIPLDRAVFAKALTEARDIRNAVMHFDDARLAPDAVTKLRNLAKLLTTLPAPTKGHGGGENVTNQQ